MFRCAKCNELSLPREKSATVVVETRLHTFPYRADANRFIRDGVKKKRDDPGGKGPQIVREIRVHRRCAA